MRLDRAALNVETQAVADETKVKSKSEKRVESISAKALWGRVITYLRTNQMLAGYLAASAISDVKFDDDQLVATSIDKNSFGVLAEQELMEKINNFLQVYDYKFKLKILEDINEKFAADIAKLKEYTSENFKIVE